MVDAAVEKYGKIDVIINNAGLMPHSPLERLKTDDRNQITGVNLKYVLYGIAAALPHMTKQKSGHIINVSPVAAIKLIREVPFIQPPNMGCALSLRDCART